MYLSPKQLQDVRQVKIAGDRSLEESIYNQHMGDRQTHTLRNGKMSSYRYLNRPLHRANGMHLLHPEIDADSVFISERKWDPEWEYSRANIPNMTTGDDSVMKYREDLGKYNAIEKLAANRSWNAERASRRISSKASMWLRPDVSTLENTYANNKETIVAGDIDIIGGSNNDVDNNNISVANDGIENFTFLDSPKSSTQAGVENYVHMNPGFYGYAKMNPYATMDAGCGYHTVAGQATRYTQNLLPMDGTETGVLEEDMPRTPTRPQRTTFSQAAARSSRAPEEFNYGASLVALTIVFITMILFWSFVLKYKLLTK